MLDHTAHADGKIAENGAHPFGIDKGRWNLGEAQWTESCWRKQAISCG